MFRKTLSMLLFAAGLAIVLTTIGGMSTVRPVQAQGVPQPTPRPPLPPEGNNKSSIGTGSGMGHIAGTVIDLTTGAPAANIEVLVGEYMLMTDVNGNYDRWLPSGTYTVALILGKDKGVAAQPELILALPEQERVIQHLAFYSPKPAAAPAAPVQVTAPAAPIQPTAVPAQSKARTPEHQDTKTDTPALVPSRLPRTGDDAPSFMLWISVGIALMAGGVFMGMYGNLRRSAVPATLPLVSRRHRAVAASTADAALLSSLLSSKLPSPKRSSDDALLQTLLKSEIK